MRKDGKFALVPWTVPASLLTKLPDGTFKSYSVDTIGTLISGGDDIGRVSETVVFCHK